MVDEDTIGKFFCVYFDEWRYWGRLNKVFAENTDSEVTEAEITFLRYVSDGYWELPKSIDRKIIEIKYIYFMDPEHLRYSNNKKRI